MLIHKIPLSNRSLADRFLAKVGLLHGSMSSIEMHWSTVQSLKLAVGHKKLDLSFRSFLR
jgi:hypothetical protein